MKSTLKVVTRKVGEGGAHAGADVQRVLRLLRRAKFLDPTASLTVWSPAATAACSELCRSAGAGQSGYLDASSDDAVLELCKKAEVVLRLSPGALGANAFLSFWEEAVDNEVPYGWGGRQGCGDDRVAYGLDGDPEWLTFTMPGAAGFVDPDFTKAGAAMNCISFTNLALSIWRTGAAHAMPYSPSQSGGGFAPISARYYMPPIRRPDLFSANLGDWGGGNGTVVPAPLRKSKPRSRVTAPPGSRAAALADYFFYDSSDVLRAARPDKLYYLQWCYPADKSVVNAKTQETTVLEAGFGHHDTVLYNGNVYETNIPKPALRCMPLGDRMNWGSSRSEAVRLYGPA